MLRLLLAACAVFAYANCVSAGDVIIGVGADNVGSSGKNDNSEVAAIHLEYHSDAVHTFGWGTVALMGVVEYNEDSDLYAGAGVSAIWNATPNWFLEASLAAGYYDAGGENTDLGGDIQFRTLLGVGYNLSDISRISIAVDHLSNGGIEKSNPGRNAVSLRYARSF